MSTADVVARFDRANAALRESGQATVTVGVVERERGEGLSSLIGRADDAMYDSRDRSSV